MSDEIIGYMYTERLEWWDLIKLVARSAYFFQILSLIFENTNFSHPMQK